MMRVLFISIILFSSQIAFGQLVEREVFEMMLGKEKANAYSLLEKSFEEHLTSNYKNKNSFLERLKNYLEDIKNENICWRFNDSICDLVLSQLEKSGLRKDILLYKNEAYTEILDYEDYLNGEISNIDTSRLEIEFSEIDAELEELLEVTSPNKKEENRKLKAEVDRQKLREKFTKPNKNGRFYYALAMAHKNHKGVNQYVSLITKHEIIPSPLLIASGFVDNLDENQLMSWEVKLIIIIELYLTSLIYHQITR